MYGGDAPTSGSLPVQRGGLETTDAAEAHDYLNRTYIGHIVRLRKPAPDFVFRSVTATVPDLTVGELRYRTGAEVTSEPCRQITICAFSGGRYVIDSGRELVRCGAGEALLTPVDRGFDETWERTELHVTQVPQAVVRRVAARLGVEPAVFRFDGIAAVSPAMNQHWLATVDYLRHAFAGPEPVIANPLVHESTLEAVAAAAVAAFPNTTMTIGYLPGPGRIDPRAVRRAVAFIDEHAAEPITIDDIATAAGLSARGLQAAFARHRDTTPTGYLRRVRMERAHRDLQSGDRSRGDTVAVIARRWGFPNPGRFAAEYRDAFGHSPGHTLRN
ncbi:AraC family transcriptional regulator [Actinoplanes sp. NPDC024001]|uniref:helix-turn-helix transcriptional regulator n=1 Tax=Actinoplanes sp. NPDC024001 TaxID=3154598 RepID=UPI0033E62828